MPLDTKGQWPQERSFRNKFPSVMKPRFCCMVNQWLLSPSLAKLWPIMKLLQKTLSGWWPEPVVPVTQTLRGGLSLGGTCMGLGVSREFLE